MDHDFQHTVWRFYDQHARQMPWRDDPSFYHVLVSEIMLQQTQVDRVRMKYDEFVREFPDMQALSDASLGDVLRLWQGLGYNRRAKFLHEAARQIARCGQPSTLDGLVALPGIGKNTAGAIMNYVYEIPTPYVETNIRTVYFHHFYENQTNVTDAELLDTVTRTIDREHPRTWFWALMDYGSWLKSRGLGRNDVSRHYKKQSPLAGSTREMRGRILRHLSLFDARLDELRLGVHADQRFDPALTSLLAEGLVSQSGGVFHLTK